MLILNLILNYVKRCISVMNKEKIINKFYDEHQLELTPRKLYKFENISKLLPKTGKMLDVGCGTGVFHPMLLKLGYRDVTGIDYTKEYINKATVDNPKYKYYVGDICKKIPFGDNTFDIVMSMEVLEHIPSPYLMLEHMYRVCKKGGCIVISTPNAIRHEIQHINPLVDKLINRIFFKMDKPFERNWKVPPNVYQYLSPNVLCGMLRDIGFEIEFTNNKYIWKKYHHIFIKGIKK